MSITLLTPKNNEKVCTIKDIAKKYIDDMHAQVPNGIDDYFYNGISYNLTNPLIVNDYTKNIKFRDSSKKIKFSFDCKLSGTRIVILSLDKEFKNIVLKKCTSKNLIFIDSLEVNKKYYWKVCCLDEASPTFSFFVSDYPRVIPLGYLTNVRDIGGRVTKSGKVVKQGLLFRGPELTKAFYEDGYQHKHNKNLTTKNVQKLRMLLGKGIDLDLRGDVECNYMSESPLNGKNYKVDYIRLKESGAYSEFFVLDKQSLYDDIKQTFEIISNADKKHVYLHCAAGADRTGTICFMLEAILGMSYCDLICDYNYTSFSGSLRRHDEPINEDTKYSFHLMMLDFEKYIKIHNLTNNIQDVIEHLLVNRFNIKIETINKIRKIFLK